MASSGVGVGRWDRDRCGRRMPGPRPEDFDRRLICHWDILDYSVRARSPVRLGVNVKFLFGNHVLDVGRRELKRGSALIAMEPQVFDLLVYLIRNRDHVVSKDDLIAGVWGGRIVSESTLTSRINAVRKAVGDSGEKQKLIRTIARKGIRFVGAVSDPSPPGKVIAAVKAEPSSADPQHETHFCTASDGVR